MNMTPPKLKPSHIYIITAVLAAVILGAIGWFWLKPDYEKIKTLTASVEALQAEGSPANLASAQNELADARKFVVDQQRIFSGMERRFFLIGDRRSPQPLDLKDRFKALQVLAIEQSQVLAHDQRLGAQYTRHYVVAGSFLTGSVTRSECDSYNGDTHGTDRHEGYGHV